MGYQNVNAVLNCLENGRWESNQVYSRSGAMTRLGEMGWEVVWGSADGEDFLLKRPAGSIGQFTFTVNIDYEKHEREEAEERKRLEAAVGTASGDSSSDIIESMIRSNATIEAQQQQEEAKAAADRRVKQGQSTTIKWLESLAATNDAYGELSLGRRYLAGDGVEKDPIKARDLLEKSAAQGNKTATDLLQSLTQK